jgi:hypothetical protein
MQPSTILRMTLQTPKLEEEEEDVVRQMSEELESLPST